MAVKDHKQADSVSVYDPKVGACHEILVEELVKQLLALGFTAEEVHARIDALKPKEV